MAKEAMTAREAKVNPLNAVSTSTRNMLNIITLINQVTTDKAKEGVADWANVASRLVSQGQLTREDANMVQKYVNQKIKTWQRKTS